MLSSVKAALKPRWIPSKPEKVTYIDPVHFNRDCITIKFVEGSRVRLRDGKLVSLNGYDLSRFHKILSEYRIRSLVQQFSRSEQTLDSERETGIKRSGKSLADLNNYYRVILDSTEAPETFIKSLLNIKIIENAHANPIATLPEDIPPETPDFTDQQGYLYEAPGGIDAAEAWKYQGGTGENVKIIDIERGWTFDHEDLKEPFFENGNIGGSPHGDAVVGIMSSQHNGYGTDGICPDAEIGGYTVSGGEYQNVANDINNTAAELDEGDLFLIELHNEYRGVLSPMETWQVIFDAIEQVTANGIICLEAGGNGGANLDGERYGGRFDPDNRHSGAILVGAGVPPVGDWGPDRCRCDFSNYGQRVDLQGWGWEVTTIGWRGGLFGPNEDTRQFYTEIFNGTSSATPIVAGAFACIQSIYKERTNNEELLTSDEIRDLLIETGSPQQDGPHGEGHIGPRPNLAVAIAQLPFRPGAIFGAVTDAETNERIEGVEITTDFGASSETDEDGTYRICYIPIGQPFNVTAHKQGFNDSTLVDFELEEGDTIEINFELLRPEFSPSEREINVILESGARRIMYFILENTGVGLLEWSVEVLMSDENISPWDHLEAFGIGQQVDDNRIEGVVFTDNRFYISGANDGEPVIYVLDRNGNLIETVPQVVEGRRGLRDLAWDGELIWGTDQNMIYGFTTDGELRTSFEAPFGSLTSITYDSNLLAFWVSGMTTAIIAMDRDGNQIAEVDREGLAIYGLGYWREAPDEFPLYVFNRDIETNAQNVHKINPATGQVQFVTMLEPEEDGSPGGVFITNEVNFNRWLFIDVANTPPDEGGDRIDVWQLEAYENWISFDPIEGQLQAGEFQIVSLTFDATGLPINPFEGELLFHHNADSGSTHIDFGLDVVDPQPPSRFSLISPEDGDTISPAQVEFSWHPSNDPFAGIDVAYLVWIEGANDSISVFTNDTTLAVLIDTLGIEYDQDSQLTWWVYAISDPDTVQSDDRFSFIHLPNSAEYQKDGIPVEFGLHSVYPNPFNEVLTILFGVDKPGSTTLTIYDISGRKVARLFDGFSKTGYHRSVWNAGNFSSGVYFINLNSDNRIRIRKTALLK